jgi:hypothetical protein
MADPVGKNQYGDDIYNTPNGQKTGTQITQELAAANWDGQGDPVAVYNRTTGATGQQRQATTGPVAGAADPAALGAAIDKLLGARASGDKAAFDEAVRQFNQNFGLSQAATTGVYNGAPTLAALKQQADIAAQKLLGAQNDAALTGTYQGQATLAALKQQADIASQQLQNAMTAAGLTGTYNGAPTLAAQNQLYTQQMGIINAAQTAQANPFRQQQLYGQANRIFSGQAVPGFQAPGTVAGVGTAGGNTAGGMGYLSQMIDDIRSPQANQTTADSFLAQTPTPNKIDSQSFLRSNPSTQNLILNAMNERYGIDPKDALSQIQNTLPQFTAPNTVGTVRRG